MLPGNLSNSYGAPVEAKWYVVHVEVNGRTKEGKVLVEFKERWQEEIENGKVAPANIPLEENGSTKNFTVIIDTDDDDRYVFDLYVSDCTPEVSSKQVCIVLMSKLQKQRSVTEEKHECEEHNGYVFRVEHKSER
ncbi:unnamed protein product [Caenorhabditis brenneri]